jgi:hypothetical protein
MKFSFKTALVVVAAAVMSFSASADRLGRTFDDFDTDFDFREDRGNQGQIKRFELYPDNGPYMEGDVIRLKQMLQDEYPRRNFANFRLKAVVLLAKAGRRGLDAQVVGKRGNKTRYKALPFNGRGSFRNPGNYDRVRFRMDQNLGRGKLQVHFSGMGRGKIQKIIVRAERVRGGQQRLQYTQVDEFRTEKFFQITQRIRVRQQDVKAIRLSASRNAVDVQSVVVVYANGDRDYLPGLEGAIYKDDSKTVKIGGRRGETVRRIEIMASSLSPFGSRGKLAVSIGK